MWSVSGSGPAGAIRFPRQRTIFRRAPGWAGPSAENPSSCRAPCLHSRISPEVVLGASYHFSAFHRGSAPGPTVRTWLLTAASTCRKMLVSCWSARFSRVWLDLAARAEILSLQLRITRPGDGQGHKENDREEIVRGQ